MVKSLGKWKELYKFRVLINYEDGNLIWIYQTKKWPGVSDFLKKENVENNNWMHEDREELIYFNYIVIQWNFPKH